MRLRLLVPCLLIPTLPLAAQKAKKAAPAPAPAAEAPAETKPEWEGEYSLKASKSDDVAQVVEGAVKDMNFALKTYWKRRLGKSEVAYPKVDVLAGEDFTFSLGSERPITVPADGGTAEWKRMDEEKFSVSMKRTGRTMTLVLDGDGGKRTLAFTLRPDNRTLGLTVTFEHPKLAEPLTYKLVYAKNE